jgi:hypothetical protein
MASVKDDNFTKEEDKVQASVAETFNTGAGRAQQAQASANNNFKPKRQGSGQATNIQKYIKANQGAGQKIAGDIAKKGQKQTDDIASKVQAAQNVYQQRAGQLQGSVQQASQAGQNIFQTAGQNPLDQQQLQQAKGLMGSELESKAK